ncbi:MAG: hypothetical protein ACK4LB_03950 [Spirosomataceae bacterium]
MKKLFIFFLTCCWAGWGNPVWAQLPTDALYMPKGSACLALQLGQTSWSDYWEDQLKRNNQNIGTHHTRMIMPMVAVGITERVNLLVGVPYLQTSTTQGNLLGERGFQDVSLWIKGKVWENTSRSLHIIGGVSTPSHGYSTDLQPMALGLGARSASVRILGNQKIGSHGYLTVSTSYQMMGNGRLDRDAHLWGSQLVYSDVVNVPDTWDVQLRVGRFHKSLQMEVAMESYACLQGDGIRRNDMPAITNDRHQSSVVGYLKYQPKNLGGTVRFQQVLAGKNVGLAQSIQVGLLYQLNPKTK